MEFLKAIASFFSSSNPIVSFVNKCIDYGNSIADQVSSWYNSSVGYILMPSGHFPLPHFQVLIEYMFTTTLFFAVIFVFLFIYRLLRGRF